jgi:ArsR family transcriptional regulator
MAVLDLHFQYFDDTRNIVASDFVDQFSALGQPGRLKIFRLLVRAGPQGLCVEDIKQRVPMPGSTLSHHLDTLTRSGLMSAKRSSRFVYYAVDWDQTARLIRFLTDDCCADLQSGLWETPDGRGRPEVPGSQSPRSRVGSLGKRKSR